MTEEELKSHLKSCIIASCPHSIRAEDVVIRDKTALGAATSDEIDHIANSILGEFFATFPPAANEEGTAQVRAYIREHLAHLANRAPAKSRAEIEERIDAEIGRPMEGGHMASITRGWILALEWVVGRAD